MTPRDVPTWDEFFIGLIYLYSGRSKDPNTQVGAVIVDKNHIPLGFGFNGAPRQLNDNEIDWSKDGKYPFIKHAEVNAIKHARITTIDGLEGCEMYVTGHPCSKCMLEIVASGIKRVCYSFLKINMMNEYETNLSKKIAEMGNLKLEEFTGNLSWVKERTAWMNELGLFK